MRCQYCNWPMTRLKKKMTNVYKFWCPRCKKTFFTPIGKDDAILTTQPKRYQRVMHIPRDGYLVFNHQNKGGAFVRALKDTDFKYCEDRHDFNRILFVLTDNDIMGRARHLDRLRQNGTKAFFVIPHTARPNLVNDILPWWQHTTAQFVAAEGHIPIMRAYGYDKPLHVIGWNLCPIKPFTPRRSPRSVLYAPIHPRCADVDREVNRRAFEVLKRLAIADDIELTVRYIGSLYESGLKQVQHPNITYTMGSMDQSYDQIDSADVVIGHQTIAYIAVARGVPTVMMAERTLPTHIQRRGGEVQFAQHWNEYVDLLAYPYDLLETDDPLGLLNRAVKSDADIADWRRRLIGTQFRKDRFLNHLQKYL